MQILSLFHSSDEKQKKASLSKGLWAMSCSQYPSQAPQISVEHAENQRENLKGDTEQTKIPSSLAD